MTGLFVIRDRLRKIYGNNATLINIVLRFLAALVTYTLLNTEIGYDPRFTGVPVVLGLSAVSAFFPLSVTVFIACVITVMHIYAASKFLSLIFILIIAVLYFLLVRFAPGYGFAVLAVPVLSALHLEALIPVLLGLIGTPIAVFAFIPGTVVYYLIGIIKDAVSISTGSVKLEDNLQSYVFVMRELTGNKEMILMLVTGTVVLLVTYFTKRLVISHAVLAAVFAGTVSYIIFMIVGYFAFDISSSIGWVLIGAVVSGLCAIVVQFFRYVLDYTAVEHLQFDDDDYYYYVTAVPKISVTRSEKKITKISDMNLKESPDER